MTRATSRRTQVFGLAIAMFSVTTIACGGDTRSDDRPGVAAEAAADFKRMPTFTTNAEVQRLLEQYDYRNYPYRHPTAEPLYGGAMRMVTNMPPRFDPLTGSASQNVSTNGLMFNQLMHLDITDPKKMFTRNFICDLCSTYEVSSDGMTYTFTLRDNVYFHNIPPVNGRKLTAEDVVYAMNVYKDKSVQSAVLQHVESIVAADPATVRIQLKRPVAGFIATISPQIFPIFARECHELAGCLDKNPIGTGPFQMAEWVPAQRLILKRNPNYFKTDATGRKLPYLDRIEEYQFADFTAQVAAFRAGQLDNLEMGFGDIDNFRALVKSMPADTKHQINSEHTCCAAKLLPNYSNARLKDVRIRRALSMAIDRQQLIDVICGGACVGGSPIPFDMLGREFSFPISDLGKYQQFNPDAARRLLDEAGLPEQGGRRFTVTVRYPATATNFNQLEAIAQMWEAIGVKIDLRPTEALAFRQMLLEGTWEELLWGGESRYGMDSFQHGYELYHSNAPKNFMRYSDPTMDDLMERERVEINPEARLALTRQIFERELDQVPIIWSINFWHFASFQPWVWQGMDHLHGWWRWWGSHSAELTWVDERSPTRTR